ncbi:hypothetical protein Bca4012_059233 [Brassica carinata]
MAISANGIMFAVIVMLFLLISTEIENGHAQTSNHYCKKTRSKLAARDTCTKKNGDALCKTSCKHEYIINGSCLILPKTTKKDCYCYHFDDGSKCSGV